MPIEWQKNPKLHSRYFSQQIFAVMSAGTCMSQAYTENKNPAVEVLVFLKSKEVVLLTCL